MRLTACFDWKNWMVILILIRFRSMKVLPNVKNRPLPASNTYCHLSTNTYNIGNSCFTIKCQWLCLYWGFLLSEIYTTNKFAICIEYEYFVFVSFQCLWLPDNRCSSFNLNTLLLMCLIKISIFVSFRQCISSWGAACCRYNCSYRICFSDCCY